MNSEQTMNGQFAYLLICVCFKECYGLNFAHKKILCWSPNLVPVNLTYVWNRVCADLIKMKYDYSPYKMVM